MMPCDSPPIGVNSLQLLHFAGRTPSAVRFRYVTPRFYLFQRDQRLAAVVSLVGHYLRDSVDMNLRLRFRSILGFSLDQLRHCLAGFGQRFVHCGGVALIRPLQRHRDHHPTFHVHRMLSFVGHMRAAVFHLRDTRICVGRAPPFLVRPFLLALPIKPRQIFPSRRRDPTLLGQIRQKGFVPLAVIASHDGSHRCVSFQCRRIHTDDLALQQATISQHTQHPAEYLPVRLNVDQPAGSGNGRMIRRVLI